MEWMSQCICLSLLQIEKKVKERKVRDESTYKSWNFHYPTVYCSRYISEGNAATAECLHSELLSVKNIRERCRVAYTVDSSAVYVIGVRWD